MLVCHLDDSGEKREPVVTLAGYLSTAEEWAEFETEAGAYMLGEGIEYLHTVDLHQRREQFKGWNSRQTHAFATELFGILGKHCSVGVEFSVSKAVFNENKVRLDMKRERAPTTFCFKGLLNRLIIDEVMQDVLSWEGVDLSFVLERGNKHNQAILSEFDRLTSPYPQLRSINEVDKRKLVALQVSDFLAYFSRRLRCMDKADPRFDDEYEFFVTATAAVKTHDHFLANNFA